MKTKGFVTLTVFYLILSVSVHAQKQMVDSFINQEMQKLHIPGFEAVAIHNGKIVWTGYYGYQSIEKKIPVTEQTIFEAASTSKTVTAAALMQLYSKGKFKLDDEINKYLDFKLNNPRHPAAPITFRQLLRHRSSIDDNVDYLSQFWETNNGDPVISLDTFIKGYFRPGGEHYDSRKNFYAYKPGDSANYSNMGIALLGYLAGRMSGMPFEEYCKTNLFKPLGMLQTGWFLKDIDSTHLAMPYRYSDSLQHYQALGYGGFPDYPAGSLHTNVEQFAHFLIAWTQKGKWEGKQVFDNKAIETLTPDDINLGFHTWSLYGTAQGELLYYHTGRANGVSSFISYSPSKKRGLIFLCNGEIDSGGSWRAIIDKLYGSVF